jgi:2-keto-4-pentenoate hydratase
MFSPLSNDATTLAARTVWQHWQDGRVMDALPEACRPLSARDGMAIQAVLVAVSGRSLVGWKIAATSEAGQRHIAVSGPMAGRLLSGQVVHAPAALSLRGNRMRVAEPEFAFRMASTLPPRDRPYAVDEVLDAVAALHPAIEVPDSRYVDFARAGEPQLIADNACAGQFMLGAPTSAAWRDIDLPAHEVTGCVVRGGRRVIERLGRGANVLGDPRVALAWLANDLRSRGLTLAAGEVVTTGTCLQPLEVAPGDQVKTDFGVFGTVGVRFADDAGELPTD